MHESTEMGRAIVILKVTMVVSEDTKRNLKSVPFTKILG